MKEKHQVKIERKGLKEAVHRKKAHQEEDAGEDVIVGTLEGEQEQQHHYQCQFFQGKFPFRKRSLPFLSTIVAI